MNTKAELQWWIEFGQKDLRRIKHKTRDRLSSELYKKMGKYCSLLGSTSKEYSKLFKYERAYYKINIGVVKDIDVVHQEYLLKHQAGAEAFVSCLVSTLKMEKNEPFAPHRTPNFSSVKIQFWSYIPKVTDGVFNSEVSAESEPEELVYFFMSMLLRGTKIADFKDCAYCKKLFLQVSREKKFCTRNCAANAAKG